MVNVLTTKEYKAISKPKKERYYHLRYSISNGLYSSTIIVDAPFKDYNAAYAWIYGMDCKPITVTFTGWK